MKLTEKHIEELYKFTRQHFVEHYDVQTELVDHLANDIEVIWQEKPYLSFEDAKKQSFKKFGVFGFMEVVKQKQKQMKKKYWRIVWSFIKEWFQLPKIILTFGLTFLFYTILQLEYAKAIVAVFYIIMIVYAYYRLYNLRKVIRKKKRKWMLEDMLLIQGASFAFVLVTYPIHFMNFKSDFDGGFITILMGFILAMINIFNYISLEIIPKKTEDLMDKNYPEYKMS